MRRRKWFALVVAVFWLAHPPTLLAAKWEITPSLGLAASYSDNILLGAPGFEESDYVLDVSPGLNVVAQGARSLFHMDYALHGVYYQDHSDQNSRFQQLDVGLKENLLGDYLSLDVVGSLQQQLIDAADSPATNNIFISNNRTDAASVQISPYALLPVTKNTNFSLRPSYGVVRYSETPEADSDITQVVAVVESRPNEGGMAWHVSGQQRQAKYQSGGEIDLEKYDAGFSIPIAMRLVWTVGAGHEDNVYDLGSTVLSRGGSLWSTGLRWEPSSTDVLAGTYGERYFGRTYGVELRHRSRYAVWSLAYSEELQTNALELQPVSSSQQVVAAPGAPALTGLQGVDTQVYVLERYSASMAWSRAKSAVGVQLLGEKRDYQVQSGSQELVSIGMSYTLTMSARSNVSLAVHPQRLRYSAADREDHIQDADIALNHTLARNVTAGASYRHHVQNSNQDQYENRYSLYSLNIRASW